MRRSIHHSISWFDDIRSDIECPVCNYKESRRSLLRIDKQTWYVCDDCRNAFVSPFDLPNYGDDYGFENYPAYYCEVGAGLEFMVAPLEALRSRFVTASYLDVGCGYGFTVHYAREALGWTALGIDPASYARQGSRDLHVPIDEQALGDGSVADAQTFDVIMASEVIEHLQDPQAFANLLRRHVNDEGVCILTTPDVMVLDPTKPYSKIVATTFPGFHCLCFSADGLRSLLENAGFGAIQVLTIGDRLIAYASPAHEGLNGLDTQARMRPDYPDLVRRTARPEALHLQAGIAYRQFRDAVVSAKQGNAAEYFQELAIVLGSIYEFKSLDPVMLRARVRISGFTAFGTTVPYMAPAMSYFAGVLAQQQGRFTDAESWFSAFLEFAHALASGSTSSLWWTEPFDLYREAQLALGTTLLSIGDNDGAVAQFDALLHPEARADLLDCVIAPLNTAVIARAVQQLGVAQARAGKLAEAAQLLESSIIMARTPELSSIGSQSVDLMHALGLPRMPASDVLYGGTNDLCG